LIVFGEFDFGCRQMGFLSKKIKTRFFGSLSALLIYEMGFDIVSLLPFFLPPFPFGLREPSSVTFSLIHSSIRA